MFWTKMLRIKHLKATYSWETPWFLVNVIPHWPECWEKPRKEEKWVYFAFWHFYVEIEGDR